MHWKRRNYLKTASSLALVGLAGCTSGDDGSSDNSDGSGSGGGSNGVADGDSGLETFENKAGVEVGKTWEAVEELAKEEGSLTMYSPNDREVVLKWLENFDYDIEVEHITGGSNKLISRWVSEYQSDQIQADCYSGATGTSRIINNEMAMALTKPEIPAYEALPDKFKSKFASGARLKPGIPMFNPNLASQDDVNSFDDFVTNEKFQGKKLGWDPTPNTFIMAALFEMFGREFFEKLRDQEPRFVDSHTDLARFCAAGEFPVSFTYGSKLFEFEDQSLERFKGFPYPAGFAGTLVNSKSHNPNATLVFLNHLSAKDGGQKKMAETHYSLYHGFKSYPESKDWELETVVSSEKANEAGEMWQEIMGDKTGV